jgi:hypothetical protein
VKLILAVDGMPFQIDTTDPELLGRWIVEIFARVRGPGPESVIQMQAWPSFVWDEDTGGWRPDWIADTRILGYMVTVKSPRGVVDALNDQIERQEAISGDHH